MGEILTLAAWPLMASMAIAMVSGRLREARRRRALNRALHELRRPLHAATLGAGPGHCDGASPLDLALVALDDLDGAINGFPAPISLRPVSARALVEGSVERWRATASRAGRTLELRWRAGPANVMADPPRVGQALDNLLVNAIEHGGLRIEVGAVACAGGLRVWVTDHGAPVRRPQRRRRRSLAAGSSGDARRGHGLVTASRIAAAHGGRLLLRHERERTCALLELPMAPTPPPEAAAAVPAP